MSGQVVQNQAHEYDTHSFTALGFTSIDCPIFSSSEEVSVSESESVSEGEVKRFNREFFSPECLTRDSAVGPLWQRAKRHICQSICGVCLTIEYFNNEMLVRSRAGTCKHYLQLKMP
jgi:hypothetical protein